MSEASTEAVYTVDVNWNKVTFGQRDTIEQEYGRPYREWGADIESDTPTARAQLLLVWLAQNQKDVSFTVAQARDVEIGQVKVTRAGDPEAPATGNPPDEPPENSGS